MRYITIVIMFIFFWGILSCQKKEEINGPVAAFTVNPPTGPFTTVFLFDATETVNEGEPDDNLRIRWDWEGDGIWDTDYSGNRYRNHRFDDAGNYNVVIEVINSLGWTDTETLLLFVYPDSVPPVASIRACPDTSSINTIFYFSAGASRDPHDTITDLRFRWDFEGDNIWDTPFICDTCIHHRYSLPGSYRAILEVKNKVQLTDTAGKAIYVFDI